jgi:hypothetical protein
MFRINRTKEKRSMMPIFFIGLIDIELHSERNPLPPPVDCGVSERIKKLIEFLTVAAEHCHFKNY